MIASVLRAQSDRRSRNTSMESPRHVHGCWRGSGHHGGLHSQVCPGCSKASPWTRNTRRSTLLCRVSGRYCCLAHTSEVTSSCIESSEWTVLGRSALRARQLVSLGVPMKRLTRQYRVLGPISGPQNNGLHQTRRGGVASRSPRPVVEARPAGDAECCAGLCGLA